MRPTPRARRTIPKAPGPDPAAPRTSTTSTAGNTSSAGSTSTTNSTGSTKKTKITFYIPADLANEARSAWRITTSQPGSPCPSFSSWLTSLIEKEIHQARANHNNNQPLTPTPPGQIPTRRPAD